MRRKEGVVRGRVPALEEELVSSGGRREVRGVHDGGAEAQSPRNPSCASVHARKSKWKKNKKGKTSKYLNCKERHPRMPKMRRRSGEGRQPRLSIRDVEEVTQASHSTPKTTPSELPVGVASSRASGGGLYQVPMTIAW